jgi:hypothetical protein
LPPLSVPAPFCVAFGFGSPVPNACERASTDPIGAAPAPLRSAMADSQ